MVAAVQTPPLPTGGKVLVGDFAISGDAGLPSRNEDCRNMASLQGIYERLPKQWQDFHRNRRILIVEDEDYVAYRLASELAEAYPDSIIDVALTGEIALDLLRAAAAEGHSYDVVVSDIYLNDTSGRINGDEVIRTATLEGLLSKTAVVVHSRDVADPWSKPLFDEIHAIETRDTCLKRINQLDPERAGIAICEVRKYRRPIEDLMWAIDAMLIKAERQDPEDAKKYLASYEAQKHEVTDREDAVLRMDELFGSVYLSLQRVSPRVEEALRQAEEQRKENIIWIWDATTFAASRDKFYGRFNGLLPGEIAAP